MRAIEPELRSPYPLASYLPDIYLEEPAGAGEALSGVTLDFPPGTYVHVVDPGEAEAAEDPNLQRGLLGEWTLALHAGAASKAGSEAEQAEGEPLGLQLTLAREGRAVATGTARASGDVISVTSSDCGASAGRYRWSFDGTALELEAIADECASRRALLAAGTWERRNFAVRFLGAFDDLLAPVFSTLDNIDAYLDPSVAPPDFVEWLAGWVDLAPNRAWPLQRRRDRIARAVELAVRLGTREGLTEVVSVFAGVDPGNVEIIENGGVARSATYGGELPGHPEQKLTVRVKVPDPTKFDAERLTRIVGNAKPAHMLHEIEVVAE